MNEYPYEQEMMSSNVAEYSVTELSMALKQSVEERFGFVRVRGEISGLKRAASGHVYLNLKDDKSVIDGVMWKGISGNLSFRPEDGLEVICTGKLTTYPGRSKYQIVIERMEPAGAGALMALLEERKRKLSEEGLFDTDRKQSIPYLPEVIGIVTSPTGAVIRDILHRLSDRFPRHVLVWPVLVQGEGAAAQISAAIDGFNDIDGNGSIPRPDLIIVARGGGSLEDLWAFNEEVVIRSVANSRIPLISAVGHETDTTLIDYVSDFRSPTPTAAAEKAVPVREDLVYTVSDFETRLEKAIRRHFNERYQKVESLGRGLPKPSDLLALSTQRFDELADRLPRALTVGLERHEMKLKVLKRLLRPESIDQEVKRLTTQLQVSKDRMQRAINQNIKQMYNQFENPSRLLESLSYTKVLERGYAVIRDKKGKALSDGKTITNGAELGIEFRDGIIAALAVSGNPTLSKKKKIDKKLGQQGQLL
ncbi:MAG: exodeoxyribonuclease VII large subunit [Proteobacteria bacterium]|jgi:exodeoxyribonuclease VII large subunit|nr:exodeoxyribonuclease VII large subunit [Pseudomonadota bacterium]